jgi:hypothetical protein
MSWRERNRIVVTLALAAALLAMPAGAATRHRGGEALVASPSGLLSQVVAWLQNLTMPLRLLKSDAGSSIDPDGARTNEGSSIDPDGFKIDEGSTIDPNGTK